MITCWIIDGRVTAVDVRGVTKDAEGAWSRNIALTASEVVGQPAVLLWSKAGFEMPDPLFPDPRITKAALDGLIDDDPARAVSLMTEDPKLGRALSGSGKTFLRLMAEAGSASTVRALLAADPRLRRELPKNQWTPLHDAGAKGREEVIRELLAAKFDKDFVSNDTTALMEAATAGHLGAVRQLVAAGADVDWETVDHKSAPTQAADRGYVEVLEALLPRSRLKFEDTPQNRLVLRTQASRGHTRMVQWMLGKKISANAKDPGVSALGAAAMRGYSHIVKSLIEGGADVNRADPKSGVTALMLAARENFPTSMGIILAAGADVNAVDFAKNSALHLAAQKDAGSAINKLVVGGADLRGRNESGLTALEVALIGQSTAAVDAFEKAGDKVDLNSKCREAALEAAVIMDRQTLLSRAVADGWPVDTCWGTGWPALVVARLQGAEKCVDVLLKAGAKDMATGPSPVVRAKDIDGTLKLVSAFAPEDPRPIDEVFEDQTVWVEVLVDAEGKALFPRIIDAPDKRLGLAAIAAVSDWRFTPVTKNGSPAAVKTRLPVQFAASNSRVVHARYLDEPVVVVSQVKPRYPRDGRAFKGEARVRVSFEIGPDGRAKNPRVLEHTGTEFADAAVAALMQWKFQPGKVAGKAVTTRMVIPIVFTLDD